ncbi:protein O-mannosyl-transferase TMTC4 isoform X2 [Anabrus simplex]
MLPVYNSLFGHKSPRAAFLSAMLFAVHPIHSEAVAGVVGRADLLCALFYCLAFLAYCNAVVHHGGLRSSLMLAASMLLCGLAMFSKEQGITVIGLCCAYDIIVHSKIHPLTLLAYVWHQVYQLFNPKMRRKKEASSDDTSGDSTNGAEEQHMLGPLFTRQVVLLATGVSLLLLRWRIMGSIPPVFQKVDNPASFAGSLLTRILTYNYIYALNAWLLVCPLWLCFDWSMGCLPLVTLEHSVDPRIFAALAFWMAFTVLLWRCFSCSRGRSRRSLTMALALVVIPFLPATNIFFRVGFVVAERVLYLPSAGYCMLVVLGLRQLATASWRKHVLQLMYFCLIVLFGLRACWRSAEWRTEEVLFRSGLQVCPLNAKVHYNIAKNAADSGNRSFAVAEYREALRLNSEYDQAMNNLANILKDEGKLEEAERYLRKAVQLRPDFAAAWMNLGIVLAGLKRHQEAEVSYFTALQHRKKYPDCYYNLGNLYLDQQKYWDAYKAWRNATTLKPTHTVAWSNMIIMLDSIGESAKAETVAHEALSVLPTEPSLHFNLANTLGKAGRFAEAEKHFAAAISYDLRNPVYYTNLGVLYHRWKKYDKAEGLYLRALELNPNLQSAKDNLALLHKTLLKANRQWNS